MASPARPAFFGNTTATMTAAVNTTAAPMASSRTLSQRLTTWMGQYARLLWFRLAWGYMGTGAGCGGTGAG